MQTLEASSPDENGASSSLLLDQCDQEHELLGHRECPSLREHRHDQEEDRQKNSHRQEGKVIQEDQEQIGHHLQPDWGGGSGELQHQPGFDLKAFLFILVAIAIPDSLKYFNLFCSQHQLDFRSSNFF